MFMTEEQKKALADIITTDFTIDGVAFSASFMYDNQFGELVNTQPHREPYPAIVMTYSPAEEEPDITDQDEVVFKVVRLTLNIFAHARGIPASDPDPFINGKKMIDAMARQILENLILHINDASVSGVGVYINEKIRGANIMDLSDISSVKHVYRNKVTLNITYEV